MSQEEILFERSLFKIAIDAATVSGTLVALHNEDLRGIGTSTILAEKAKELSLSLVVGNPHTKNSLETAGYKNIHYVTDVNQLRGIRPSNCLVDVRVKTEILKFLSKEERLFGGVTVI